MQTKPFTYVRLYADENGASQFEDVSVDLTNQGKIGWLSEMIPATGIQFRETPPDYDYDWHNAPRRQFIIMLDGKVEIQISDGAKRLFDTGDVLLVEDTTGQGHISKAIDGKFRKSIFISLEFV